MAILVGIGMVVMPSIQSWIDTHFIASILMLATGFLIFITAILVSLGYISITFKQQ